MNSEGIQGRLPGHGLSNHVLKDELEISSWKKYSPELDKTKVKWGGKIRQPTKWKELNIQTLRGRHLGSKRAPEPRTRAWHLAGPYLMVSSLSMIAVFPSTIHWFLPANGFNSNLPLLQHCHPRRKVSPSKLHLEESQGRTLIGQVWVMCLPWTNSCGQATRVLRLAHQGGMLSPLPPESKVTWESDSSMWTHG